MYLIFFSYSDDCFANLSIHLLIDEAFVIMYSFRNPCCLYILKSLVILSPLSTFKSLKSKWCCNSISSNIVTFLMPYTLNQWNHMPYHVLLLEQYKQNPWLPFNIYFSCQIVNFDLPMALTWNIQISTIALHIFKFSPIHLSSFIPRIFIFYTNLLLYFVNRSQKCFHF